MTPDISISRRLNLFNILNNKINENPLTPNPFETEKANLDISEDSIIKYLANNHFFDNSNSHLYNPTIIGKYFQKHRNNDTNNKILNHNKDESSNKKSRISLNKLKNYIKENSLNSKNKIYSHKNEILEMIRYGKSNSINNEEQNSIIKIDEPELNNLRNKNLEKKEKNVENKNNTLKIDNQENLLTDRNKNNVNNKDLDFLKNSDEKIFLEKNKNNLNTNKDFFESKKTEKSQTVNLTKKIENNNTTISHNNLSNKKLIKKPNLQSYMIEIQTKIQENEKGRKKNILHFLDFKKTNNQEEIKEEQQFNVMNLGILIEGDSISHCLDDEMKILFWNIIKNSRSVVCCRCSPKQKSEVVTFVKNQSKEVTLAIGDGGNDIPMLKSANIGVGIFGKEGYQAAFNSDFAISQFKYLKRLIFVHGRFSLVRNSYFIYFFFFKNVLFTVSQLWFCFFSGFSGLVYKFFIYFFIIFFIFLNRVYMIHFIILVIIAFYLLSLLQREL